MIVWLLACAADTAGPATSGSVLAQEVATAEEIAALSSDIETKAKALEQKVAEARSKELTPDERVVLVTELKAEMAAIEAKDKALMEAVKGVELRLSQSVDPHDRTPGVSEAPNRKPK